ncbi:hypothetical protein RhiirA5_438316 [Rhizophagus irregularis]|uniref:HTH myb-type domain-containing protein n=1 Tax=Rhizophagus irregularis TaxID=588596 RepID=A0A2N0R0S6_9GLOM|nr:hypothetical protein RhiirA5_438316 [Rhizophagus irregularis]PKC56906.1 hypothetical protein RhiirA1_473321 [Rhizophagus irregularis]
MKIGLIDDEIIKFMNENKNERHPYTKASKEINKGFSPKQIRHRWISKLKPDLCHEKLCEDEELYIIEWVEKYRNEHPFNKINWKQLILDLRIKFYDASSSPQVSFPQDSNSPKSVQLSPQDNNVSITVITFKKDKVSEKMNTLYYHIILNLYILNKSTKVMKIENLPNKK